MKGKLWSKGELIVAFNLYLKLPFGRIYTGTPEIKELARLLGRTPSSIAMRLANFASCDPYHQNRGVKGMNGGLKQCQPIWDEFAENRENLLYESERILADMQGVAIENKFFDMLLDIQDIKGEEKVREVKTRVNQNVFRDIVVANYDKQCAITGIDIPELLVASHIVPWSQNAEERLNPENGICLSMLYDKAFDRGLIGISNDYKVIVSNQLKYYENRRYYQSHFGRIEGIDLNLPKKYMPNPLFLEWHLNNIFHQ